MSLSKQLSGPQARISSERGRDVPRIAVVVEDLRSPLDEGAKKTCFSLIESLGRQGAQVSVFTWYGNSSLPSSLQLPRNKLLLGASFARSLRGQAPHLILYIPSSSGTMAAFVRAAIIKAQAPGVPLALLSLQYRELPASARYLGLRRHADIVLTQSQKNAAVYQSLGCQTLLLPAGVDGNVFHPVSRDEKLLLRSKYGFQDTDVIVLHVGHCKADRNVMALARLAESGFTPVLVASTSTALDTDLQARLERSGVKVVTQFIDAVQHFYQLADCYVFPVSHAASAIDAPLSVLEAMACNLPVITTRFGALEGLFEPGSGLYYFDSEDEMACLVKQAVTAQDCRTKEKVLPYSWDRVACAILDTVKERAWL